MSAQTPALSKHENFVARHPAITYFALTFTVSWLGAFVVATPHLLRGKAIPKFAGLMMFPAMLLGPSMVGILLTWFIDGSIGLRDLFLACAAFVFPRAGSQRFSFHRSWS